MKKNQKPNLLFIFTDEQAQSVMKAYGNEKIQTPNMDMLASKSIVFQNAYVTQPVCTPSRSTLMTGLYPHTNGCVKNNVPLDENIPCFPELGMFSDYQTAYMGKWHLGDEVFAQHGFNIWRSIDDGYRMYYREGRNKMQHSTYHSFLIENGFKPDAQYEDGFAYFSRNFCARLPEEYSKPAYLAKEAIEFLKANKHNPFILYINFFEPHMPFFGPRDNQYNPEEVTLPENFYHELSSKNPLKTRLFREVYYREGQSGLELKTENDWRQLIANYWGLISLVDTYLGHILHTLEELNLFDNTIIVYTSDHGDMMGSHRLLGKCVMFEEAVKVPLLLYIPDMDCHGRTVYNPVSQIDLVPTLLDAMGQSIPSHLQGYSWMPFLKGTGPSAMDDVFIEWNGNDGAIFTSEEYEGKTDIEDALSDAVRTVITADRWKYNWSKLGEDELYNLNNDPYEMNNLVTDRKYSALIQTMRKKIIAWQKRTKDFNIFSNNPEN